MGKIANFNEQITEDGIAGLGHKDHHWLAEPLAHVLQYSLEHKAQRLESNDLAQTWFANCWH
jgi:hypothetical protein